MKNKRREKMVIYQARSGRIEFRGDVDGNTVWGNLSQIAELFGRDKSVISRHIKNVFQSGELEAEATVAKIATVQKEGNRQISREIEYYNLDLILSVGYRVDSKQATQFRIWATKTLKRHLLQGYTINRKRIGTNYAKFLQTVEDIKKISVGNTGLKTSDVLGLIKTFAGVWFSLESYDRQMFPQKGLSKKTLAIQSEDLYAAIATLKVELLRKDEATELFAQEKTQGSMEAILASVLQSAFSQDAYPSIEEKAAHLLYFTIKNHPFNDGNKRTGAFCFIWFLQKAGFRFRERITPETLTALTLLIAESKPGDKEQMIGLIVLLLSGKYK